MASEQKAPWETSSPDDSGEVAPWDSKPEGEASFLYGPDKEGFVKGMMSRLRAAGEGAVPYAPEMMAAADTGIDKLAGGDSSYADNVASRWKQYQQDREAHPGYGLAGDLAGAYKVVGPAIGKALSPFSDALAHAGKTGTVVNTMLGLAGYNAARDPGPRDPDEGVLQGQKRLDNASGGFKDPYQLGPALAFGALGHHFANSDVAGNHAAVAESRANDAALRNAGASPRDFELALDSPDAKQITQRLGNEARELMHNSGKLLPDATDIHGEANKSLADIGKGIGELTQKAKMSENAVDVNALMQDQARQLPSPDTQDIKGEWLPKYQSLKEYFGRLGRWGQPIDDGNAPLKGSINPSPDAEPHIGGVGTLKGITDDLGKAVDWGRLREDMPAEQQSLNKAYFDSRGTQNAMIDDALGGNSGIQDMNRQYSDLMRLKEMARWKTAQNMAKTEGPKGVPVTKGQLPYWTTNTSRNLIMKHWPAAQTRMNETIQKVFEASPELAAKYMPNVQKAFQQSPEMGSAYIYNLLSRPDIKDHLQEQPDRSRDKVVSHDDAKNAFLEGTGGQPPDQDQ